MPTPQKIVQTLLRWSTPLLILAALGGTTMGGIFVGGRMLSAPRPSDAIDSPDHRYRVYIFLNNENGKGSSVIVVHPLARHPPRSVHSPDSRRVLG